MLENVRQVTIEPIIRATVASDSKVFTDEYDIYARLTQWGYVHSTVCHGVGEYARDDDGDGFHEVHSTPSRGSGRFCALGFDLIVAYLKKDSLFIWDSSSLFTTSESAGKPCSSP